jgi:hypothetical protein
MERMFFKNDAPFITFNTFSQQKSNPVFVADLLGFRNVYIGQFLLVLPV